MLRENEVTRAIRRAQHDTYAPFSVRPAVRGDVEYRRRPDAFDRQEKFWNYAGAFAICVFVGEFLHWAFTAW